VEKRKTKLRENNQERKLNTEVLSGIDGSILDGLQSAEKNLVAFVEEKMTDREGLILSDLRADTLKPWTEEQIQAPDIDTLPVCDKKRGQAADQMAYEDSLMATAEYALAMIFKHKVTGSAEALATAAHASSALLRVFYEGEKYERGYLPKPHGGIARAAYSHEISPDQYIKTVIALREWSKLAPPSERKTIDSYIVAAADYFVNRNFTHNYRDRTLVCQESRIHCVALYIPLLLTAANISGDSKYSKLTGLFDKSLDSLLKDPIVVNFNIFSLFTEGFDLAIREGSADKRLKDVILRQWRENLNNVLDDGCGYENPEHGMITSRVIRMAAAADIVESLFPETEAVKTGLFILSKITDPLKMLHINNFKPEWGGSKKFYSMSLCETSISSWILAHWRLKNYLAKAN
jgi:hypothetical protein